MTDFIPTIDGIMMLDGDGGRLFSKCYNGMTETEQEEFEKKCFNKSKGSSARNEPDVLSIAGYSIIFKVISSDVFLYVYAKNTENELVSLTVLQTIEQSLSQLLRSPSKRSVLENLDMLLLLIDEIIDDGMILEDDSSAVVQRVVMQNNDDDGRGQTLPQALQQAKDEIGRSLISFR